MVLEFWPDYGGGPLWADGRAVDLGSLGLSGPLQRRLEGWNGRYDEARLPFAENDEAWLAEGRALLAEVRAELTSYSVVVTEPWWGEEPITP